MIIHTLRKRFLPWKTESVVLLSKDAQASQHAWRLVGTEDAPLSVTTAEREDLIPGYPASS